MRAALLLCLAGCDSLWNLAEVKPQVDAPSMLADVAIADAPEGWTVPVPVTLHAPPGTAYTTDVTFTEDRARVIYAAATVTTGTTFDLYESTMSSATESVGSSQKLVTSNDNRASPELSPDGRILYFYDVGFGIGVMTRDVVETSAWMVGVAEGLNSGLEDRPGGLDRTKQRLVIGRSERLVELVGGAANYTIADSTNALDAITVARNPHLSPDALTLVFAGQDVGDASVDLYVASRAAPGDNWRPPVKLTTLSDPQMNEEDPWLSNDGRHIYFTRGTQILYATRL